MAKIEICPNVVRCTRNAETYELARIRLEYPFDKLRVNSGEVAEPQYLPKVRR